MLSQIRAIFVVAALAAALSLTGCAGMEQQTSTDENAAENRAYMAQLNQRTDDLEDVLVEFQAAVGTADMVTMKAAANKAGTIVEQIKSTDAPEKLAPIKEDYVKGLDQLQTALGQYTQLFGDLSSGAIDEAGYADRLKQVQEAYDQGVEALKAADEQAVAVANE